MKEAFEKWWQQRGGFNVEYPSPKEISERVWNAAWVTAKMGQWEATKLEVISEIKAKFLQKRPRLFSTETMTRPCCYEGSQIE